MSHCCEHFFSYSPFLSFWPGFTLYLMNRPLMPLALLLHLPFSLFFPYPLSPQNILVALLKIMFIHSQLLLTVFSPAVTHFAFRNVQKLELTFPRLFVSPVLRNRVRRM